MNSNNDEAGRVNCLLIYYTGTFNTRYITQKVKLRLEREGWNVSTYEIDPLNNESLNFSAYDMIGFGSPIYGFAAPWPFLKFIRHQRFPAQDPRGKGVDDTHVL